MNRQGLEIKLKEAIRKLHARKRGLQTKKQELESQIDALSSTLGDYHDCLEGGLQFVPASLFLNVINLGKDIISNGEANTVYVCDNMALHKDEGESK